jgi:hypothetical protein
MGRTVWKIGALYYPDVTTVCLRGLLAIVAGLVTTRACLRLPQIARSASTPELSCAGLGMRLVAREDTGTPWASA